MKEIGAAELLVLLGDVPDEGQRGPPVVLAWLEEAALGLPRLAKWNSNLLLDDLAACAVREVA